MTRILAVAFVVSLQMLIASAYAQEIVVTVEFLQQVTLSPRDDGFIKTFDAREGLAVFKGDSIVKLDSRETDLELEQLSAEIKALKTVVEDDSKVNAAKAKLRSSSENLKQLEAIPATGGVTLMERVRAKSSRDEAKASLDGAHSEIVKARFDLSAKQFSKKQVEFKKRNLEVLSPFDGSLIDIQQFAGNFVAKGTPIATIYRMDRLSGIAVVDRNVLSPQDAIGKQFYFHWDRKLGQPENLLKIVRTSPRVDADNLYRAYFEFDNVFDETNKQWQLIPGMTVVAEATEDSN